METTITRTMTRIIITMLKDFASDHTTTSLAKAAGVTRVGAWKALRRLSSDSFITTESVGAGKTNATLARLFWGNPLLEKTLALSLTEESLRHRRWRTGLAELEGLADFTILYGSILRSPQTAHDIDLLAVISKKKDFLRFQDALLRIQKTQSKHIHSITFTPQEISRELRGRNEAMLDAVRTGIVLFGQERFVAFMRRSAAT